MTDEDPTLALLKAAAAVRLNAYAPYSKFLVGAALRSESGKIYSGCNVENIAYPEGTCAEAGAIAAMIADGETRIAEIVVIAGGTDPVAPCGGCRQKISEFALPDAKLTMATTQGAQSTHLFSDFLPGAFGPSQMN